MLLAVLIANSEGNILVERYENLQTRSIGCHRIVVALCLFDLFILIAGCCSFNGVPAEERLHWRSFLVKLGVDNLRGVKNEELLVANHKYVKLDVSSYHFSCQT